MTRTRFTPEIWATVLDRVSNGDSLRQVCRTDGFPPEATIRNWIRSDQELATQYAQARVLQIESRADEVRDEAFMDDLEPDDKRVRVDALKWLLSKLKPERYGVDRLLVVGDQANPIPCTQPYQLPSSPILRSRRYKRSASGCWNRSRIE